MRVVKMKMPEEAGEKFCVFSNEASLIEAVRDAVENARDSGGITHIVLESAEMTPEEFAALEEFDGW